MKVCQSNILNLLLSQTSKNRSPPTRAKLPLSRQKQTWLAILGLQATPPLLVTPSRNHVPDSSPILRPHSLATRYLGGVCSSCIKESHKAISAYHLVRVLLSASWFSAGVSSLGLLT